MALSTTRMADHRLLVLLLGRVVLLAMPDMIAQSAHSLAHPPAHGAFLRPHVAHTGNLGHLAAVLCATTSSPGAGGLSWHQVCPAQ
eukprot:COSAG02_NODE_45_length_45811_cov_83.565891_23_plen_86_part_00